MENQLPQGVLHVNCPPIGSLPEVDLILWPHFAGLGYQVRDYKGKILGNISTQNVKDNIDNGFYILNDNSEAEND